MTPHRLQPIPTAAVQRLSLYLRRLEELNDQSVTTVSSRDLAADIRVTAAQVRRDLTYFGQFGKPGLGYAVGPLIQALRGLFGTDKLWHVVVVGAGDLGRALMRYRGFASKGFKIVAAFDVADSKIGRNIGGVSVHAMSELPSVVRHHDVKLAVLATPPEAAQHAAHQLHAAGVRGILNFAPTMLETPADLAVGPVDLAASLEQLSFQVHEQMQPSTGCAAAQSAGAQRT
jgi:redox-sensing transcriptional repressor